MRKQLLACAVLAATMVPSLAGAGIISISAVEGAVPGPNLCGGPPSNNCQLTAVPTGNFTSNMRRVIRGWNTAVSQ